MNKSQLMMPLPETAVLRKVHPYLYWRLQIFMINGIMTGLALIDILSLRLYHWISILVIILIMGIVLHLSILLRSTAQSLMNCLLTRWVHLTWKPLFCFNFINYPRTQIVFFLLLSESLHNPWLQKLIKQSQVVLGVAIRGMSCHYKLSFKNIDKFSLICALWQAWR